MKLNRGVVSCAAFSALIGGLWAFPALWYSGAITDRPFVWLTEKTAISGWEFRNSQVSESAESTLVADATLNGQFRSGGSALVRVFAAKRFEENSVGMGVLGHPPDLCWTLAGWKLRRAEPVFTDCPIEGLDIRWERRLFETMGHTELVYYGALVGGQPLPYRLDQYLAWAGTKPEQETALSHYGGHLRDRSYWEPVWEAFRNRVPLSGPQEFFRISTPVMGPGEIDGHLSQGEDALAAADKLLHEFLPQWLQRGDYQKEYEEWLKAKGKEARGHRTADGGNGAAVR